MKIADTSSNVYVSSYATNFIKLLYSLTKGIEDVKDEY